MEADSGAPTLSSHLARLPAEIWAHIIALEEHDSVAKRCRCALYNRKVCKSWAEATGSGAQQFWLRFTKSCFPDAGDPLTVPRIWEHTFSSLWYCYFRYLYVKF
jgi:hypothetical protein